MSRVAVLTFLTLAVGQTALLHAAGYTVTILGSDQSEALGVGGGTQGGDQFDVPSSQSHAFLWNGANPGTDLNPTGAANSQISAVSSSRQVGRANFSATDTSGTLDQAMVWYGTAASAFDLSTPAYSNNDATGTAGNTIVGFGSVASGSVHALVWSGSGTSYTLTDLHTSLPTAGAYTDSSLFATDGATAVGQVINASGSFAAAWDLTSANAFTQLPSTSTISQALGVSGTQVVGFDANAGLPFAALWTRTGPGTYLESNLQGADPAILSSVAAATNGTNQVGYIFDATGNTHAVIWSGTPGSDLPLEPLLPTNYIDPLTTLPVTFVSSQALGIDANGNIVGTASDATGDTFAVLWSATATPEPASLLLFAPAAFMLMRKRSKHH